MTTEEIERILQTVAENQAQLTGHATQTDERLDRITERLDQAASRLDQVTTLQAQHSADIVEIDRLLGASLQSQNRYDEQLTAIREIMHTLADKQLKNEELFVELAASRERHEARMAQLEASYELFEGFVRDFRAETIQRLDGLDEADVQTESRLDALIDAQILLTARVDTLTGDIAALNGRVDRIGEHLDQVAALQGENAGQIKALVAAQARTDKQIRMLLDRNGSTTALKARAKKPGVKKTAKKRGGAAK